MTMWRGNIPEGREWVKIGGLTVGEERWLVFFKPQAHTDDWVTYKVCADGRVVNKANYWFIRNIKTGGFTPCTDLKLIKEHRPALWTAIQDWL